MALTKTSGMDQACEFPSTINSFRLQHHHRSIVLRFAAEGTAWELAIPDEDVNFSTVRVTIRELGSQRGAEASVLMPWSAYTRARDWLRCVPDGWPPTGDIQPALTILSHAFGPIASAVSSLL